jgi:hypothetical protein
MFLRKIKEIGDDESHNGKNLITMVAYFHIKRPVLIEV